MRRLSRVEAGDRRSEVWRLGFSKHKENPNPSKNKPEDPAGLTAGMAPPPEAPLKSAQVRNGSNRKQPPERDKQDESRSAKMNIDKEQNKEEEQNSDSKGGSRPPGSCLSK